MPAPVSVEIGKMMALLGITQATRRKGTYLGMGQGFDKEGPNMSGDKEKTFLESRRCIPSPCSWCDRERVPIMGLTRGFQTALAWPTMPSSTDMSCLTLS